MADLLMVFDANNFLIRNAVGGGSFRDQNGEPLQTTGGVLTGVILGAVNAWTALYKRFQPTHVVFTFDHGRSDFRRQIRASYKANRNGSSSSEYVSTLVPQFKLFTEFLDIIGIPHLRYKGVEADDLIASIVHKAYPFPTMIVSADHDILQLVSETVTVFRNSIGKSPETIFDRQAVVNKYGLAPEHLPTMWALQGDKGDNIIGIPKVGPVTAAKMVKEWGTDLDEIIKNDPKCVGYEDVLRENLDMIKLSGDRFANLIPDDLDLEFTPTYSKELREYFERFELKSLVNKFDEKSLWNTARTMRLGSS